MLKINNLTVKADNKEILHDFNLNINDGEIHVIMGPNGIGKSTIVNTIMGNKNYEVTKGSIEYNNEDLLKMDTTTRARKGLILINQSPIAIEGVTNAEMLRSAIQEKNQEKVNIFEFNKKLQDICKKLDIPTSFIHRNINDGMSGGERKKNELMHMWMLEPKFLMLDELDSGLDVDALKVCSNSIMEYYKEYKPSILIITHHTQILDIIKPDYVHIIKDGTICYTGNLETARKIENQGFNINLGQTK